MKNIKNKLLLLIAICALLTPTFVYAVEETPSPTTTPEATENPTESPEPTPSPSATPTPTPEAPAKEDTEAVLSDLEVSEGKWDKKFASSTFDYTITVNSKVSGIVITAEKFGNAVVSGDTGTKSLEMGDNTFTIKVTSKDGNNTNTYTLKVVRATDNLNLKSLKIKGQNINEVFAADTYDYTADITYNVESITVQAAADDENATVTVSGSSNLKVGRNTVKVIVKNAAGETTEYRIIVTRGSEEDLNSATEEEDDESNQVVSSSIVAPEVSTPEDDDTTTNEKENNTLKYVLIVIFCVLLLGIAGLGIYFYFATDNSKKRVQKKIDRLKKKQEKIEQELTGLLPIIKEEHYLEVEEETAELEEEPINLEDTIEIEENLEEELTESDFEEPKKQKRVDRNVLEDFDDIFLDE